MATPGLDLSAEGWTQCYGWKNTGPISPRHATMQKYCGSYAKVKFAGWRCRATNNRANLVEHDVNFASKRMKFGVWLNSKSVNRGDSRMSNVEGHNKGTGKAAKYNWYANLRIGAAARPGSSRAALVWTRWRCHPAMHMLDAIEPSTCVVTCTAVDGRERVVTQEIEKCRMVCGQDGA